MAKRHRMPATARPRVTATVRSFAELGRVVADADRAAAERLKRSAPLRNRKATR